MRALASSAGGDGLRRAGALRRTHRRCPRWSATPRCWSTPPATRRRSPCGLARLASDAALRTELRARGLARAAQFTWDRCAEETLAVLGETRKPSLKPGTAGQNTERRKRRKKRKER